MVTVLAVGYLASEVLKENEKKGKEFVRRCKRRCLKNFQQIHLKTFVKLTIYSETINKMLMELLKKNC